MAAILGIVVSILMGRDTSSLSDLAGRNYVNSWNDAMILWP